MSYGTADKLAEDLVLFAIKHDTYECVDVFENIHDESNRQTCIEETAYKLGNFDRTSFVSYLQQFVDDDGAEKEEAAALLERVRCLNPVYPARVENTNKALGIVKMFCDDYFGEATEMADGCTDCPFAGICEGITKHGQRLSEVMDAMLTALNDEALLKEAREWYQP